MTDRRTFLKKSAALAAMTLASASGLRASGLKAPGIQAERILPRRLKKGDLIGLVTPGSSVTEKQLADCITKLQEMGFRTTYNSSVLSEYGYFAGKDQERADELMEMFTREDVDAIWCVRGGYGSIRILDLLDYEQIKKNPKVFIGYSDITALLTAIYQETGLVTFHGPVGISDFNRFSLKSMTNVLMEADREYKYPYKRAILRTRLSIWRRSRRRLTVLTKCFSICCQQPGLSMLQGSSWECLESATSMMHLPSP